jgi:4-amino-4-deoxy-L-arabinose transferase-like glycosyltransferase
MQFIKRNWIVLVIFFLAFILRFYHLGHESLFWDELEIITRAKASNLNQAFTQVIWNDFNPPLYFTFLRIYLGVFGFSDIVARIPSAFFGALAVLLMYKVGRMIFSEKIGLLAAFLLAISPFNIFYSQSARMYSMLLFFGLLSMFFFLKLLNKQTILNSLLYIFSSVLMIYLQSFGFVILLTQNIFILFHFRSKILEKFNFKNWILSQILIVIAFSFWLNIFYHQAILVKNWHPWGKSPPLYGHYLSSSLIEFSGSKLMLMLFLLLIVLIILNLFLKHFYNKTIFVPEDRNENYYLRLAVLLFIIPLIIPILLSFLTPNLCCVRYAVVSSIGIILLIAYGIFKLRNKIAVISLIFLIILLGFFSLKKYYSTRRFEDWREAARFVDQMAPPKTLLVFTNFDYTDHGLQTFKYYSKRDDYATMYIKRSNSWDRDLLKNTDYSTVIILNSDDTSSFWSPGEQVVSSPDVNNLPVGWLSSLEQLKQFPGVDIYQLKNN